MAKHTSKQAKTKPEPKVDTGTTKKAVANSEHEPQRGNRRALSQSGAARTDRAAANAAAVPKVSLNGSHVVHDKPEPARSCSKPGTEQVDLKAPSASGAEQPPASTKRAQLIDLLERSEGATVAEIGQRLGWLPHTVRAAITGLRKAGREVTRTKNADDRSLYRLVSIKTANKR
jgi:DNA-binding CsgD family transcriptional regulator